MPKLAANLSTLFREMPFVERFAAAAEAGFRAVEFQFPYEWPSGEVARAARSAAVEIVLHNMPRGDPDRGELGTACLPGREARFREDLERAVRYAAEVGCRRIHCLAGVVPPEADPADCEEAFLRNIGHAAERLAREGMEVLLEPLSPGTVAGCFLAGSRQAEALIRRLGAPNVRLQYDLFHMQLLEGNLAATLQRLLPIVGHVQLADVPGRHEPGTGELNYSFLLSHLDRIGYGGWVGCEYNPQRDTLESLTWATPWLSPPGPPPGTPP